MNLTLDSIFNRWRLSEQYALVLNRIDFYANNHLILLLVLRAGLVLALLLPLPCCQLCGRGRGRGELVLQRGPLCPGLRRGRGRREEGGERGDGPGVLLAHDLHQSQPRHRVEGAGEARGQEVGGEEQVKEGKVKEEPANIKTEPEEVRELSFPLFIWTVQVRASCSETRSFIDFPIYRIPCGCVETDPSDLW